MCYNAFAFGLTEEEFKSLLDPTSFLGQHLKTFDEYVENEVN